MRFQTLVVWRVSGPCWLIRSSCEREFEAGEVAGSGAVQSVPVPVGVEPDEVERDGGVDVFEPGLGQAAVAGAARPGDRDGLADGALDTGPPGVAGLPVRVFWVARAAACAWWISRGGTVSWRPYVGEVERVHCSRTGQPRQVPAANLITIASVPRWVTGFHQVEVWPCGHRARSVSKSMVNPAQSYPAPALAWWD